MSDSSVIIWYVLVNVIPKYNQLITIYRVNNIYLLLPITCNKDYFIVTFKIACVLYLSIGVNGLWYLSVTVKFSVYSPVSVKILRQLTGTVNQFSYSYFDQRVPQTSILATLPSK